MAVTSIWSVKGQLGKVVIYVENPEKTMHPEVTDVNAQAFTEEGRQGLSDVIAYAVNEEKTRRKEAGRKGGSKITWKEEDEIADEGENLMQQYVSGINCAPATARMEMTAAKKRYGKDTGIIAFHGYQSFAPGECTPAMAHEIGVKLAERLWGSRFQVLVATHLDQAHHLHNHFVVNSVSFIDGLRYHRTNQDYRDMRMASDQLCREYGLSVVEQKKQGRAKHYGEWKAEQEGKPTYKGLVKEDVDDAVKKARTEKQFYHCLKEKGYSIKFGKDITVRPAGRERGLKLARNFGEEYTIEAIRRRILTQAEQMTEQEISKGKQIQKPVDKLTDLPQRNRKRVYAVKLNSNRRRIKKIGGLRGMYLRYCYLLGILPKNRPAKSPREMHSLLREDLMKLNTISKETELLCHYRIDTAEQLCSLKEELKEQIQELTEKRKLLRSRSRSIRDQEELSKVKAEIHGLTGQIQKYRKEAGLCEGIAVRSGIMEEKMETMRQEKRKKKEENSHEHIRRSR